MAAIPPPPSNDWALEITALVEDLLVRVEKLEDVSHNLLEQNEQWVKIRKANETISALRDRMLVVPVDNDVEPPLKKIRQ